MPNEFHYIICAAKDLLTTLRSQAMGESPVGTVLSFEHSRFAITRGLLLAQDYRRSQVELQEELVSLGYAPRLNEWPEFQDVPQHILTFRDIEIRTPRVAPTVRHLKEIRSIVKKHLADCSSKPIVFQCAAAAVVGMIEAEQFIFSRRANPTQVVERLVEARPTATPNRLMIADADELFGYDGELIQAATTHPRLSQNYGELRQR